MRGPARAHVLGLLCCLQTSTLGFLCPRPLSCSPVRTLQRAGPMTMSTRSGSSSSSSSSSGGGAPFSGYGRLWASLLDVDVKQQAGPTAAVTYRGPKELRAGEEIIVVYNPPQATSESRSLPSFQLDPDKPLCFMGGFNGWDGETSPLILPAFPQEDGSYEVTLSIPVFAKTVDFIFSDGISFDTNQGDYYHLRMRHVQERGRDGNVRYFLQDEEGNLEPTGQVDEYVDPQELERMIDAEVQKRKREAEQQQQAAAQVADERQAVPQVPEGMPVKVTKEEQRYAQRLRAEASAAGELLGLLKIQCHEAREAFDRFDDDRTATLARKDLGRALEQLGFYLGEEEVEGLLQRHAEPGEGSVDLVSFMHMFAELDHDDVGIDML